MSEYYATLTNRLTNRNCVQLAKTCQICNNDFNIYYIQDTRMVCPECCRRLKNLLYPEVNNDD